MTKCWWAILQSSFRHRCSMDLMLAIFAANNWDLLFWSSFSACKKNCKIWNWINSRKFSKFPNYNRSIKGKEWTKPEGERGVGFLSAPSVPAFHGMLKEAPLQHRRDRESQWEFKNICYSSQLIAPTVTVHVFYSSLRFKISNFRHWI